MKRVIICVVILIITDVFDVSGKHIFAGKVGLGSANNIDNKGQLGNRFHYENSYQPNHNGNVAGGNIYYPGESSRHSNTKSIKNYENQGSKAVDMSDDINVNRVFQNSVKTRKIDPPPDDLNNRFLFGSEGCPSGQALDNSGRKCVAVYGW